TFFFLRLLYGIGMGGEWGVGASLTMESVPARWRGLISGLLQDGYALGFLLAAGAYRLVYPHWGWRPLFFVGGLPALLTLFVRAKVKEPEAWYRSRTDWASYRRAIFGNWQRFAYLVVLQVGGVTVLCAVRDEVHHGHQHHEIGKALPVSEYRSAVTRPIRARTVPSFGLFHFCADKKRKQRRQSADKKQRAPPPVRINKAVRPGCEQESQRIAFLQ